jgi:hypothetical protein
MDSKMKATIFLILVALFSGVVHGLDTLQFNENKQYVLDKHKVQFGIWTGQLEASKNTSESLKILKRQIINSINSIEPLQTGSYKFPQLKSGETSIIFVPYISEYEKQYAGLGITFGTDENTGSVKVSSIFPNSPARRSGLKVNDFLVKINDTPVKGLGLKDVIEMLKGDKGESANLVIQRNGLLSKFKITRSTIHYMAHRTRVGYIALYISGEGVVYRTWHNTNRWYKLKPSKLSLKRDWLFGSFKVSVSMSIDKPNNQNIYSIALAKSNVKTPSISSTHSYEGQNPQVLDNEQSTELLNKLFPLIPSIGSPVSWNTPIKSSTLPFYTNGKLIEVTANTHKGTKGAYNFITIGENAYLLNGTGTQINKVNKENKLDLGTEFLRTEYLKFYTHSIESKEGPFLVTVKGDNLPISNRRLIVLSEAVMQTLQPLTSQNNNGNWIYKTKLFNGDTLRKATFELTTDGFLKIKNNSLITNNIPRLRQYTSDSLKIVITPSNRELSNKEIDTQMLVAANLGNASAQFEVGRAYNNGIRVEKSYETAFNWFLKAAKQDHADAEYEVGLYYDGGFGVVQDSKKSAFWYEKSANKNNAKAQFRLGRLYDTGRGVEKNHSEGFKWNYKAANNGSAPAMYILWVNHKINKMNHKINDIDYSIRSINQGVSSLLRGKLSRGEITKSEYDRLIVEGKKDGNKTSYQNSSAHLKPLKMTESEAKKWLIKAAKLGFKNAIEECIKEGISCI